MVVKDLLDGDSGNSTVIIVKPCFKPCGCHCQRACNCNVRYNRPVACDDSTASDSSSSSSGYSCTPSDSTSSSSDSYSISSESVSGDTQLSRITFDRKPPCQDSNSSSSSTTDSTVSPFSVDSSDSRKCRANIPLDIVASPQLNCVNLLDGRFKSSCGAVADGEYFIQWYPVSVAYGHRLEKYTVYAKRGSEVSVTTHDFKYDVDPESHYLLTPAIGDGVWSFVVTASAVGFDGVDVESDASEVFETS